MEAGEVKLRAVLRAVEVQEAKLLEERSRIEEVANQRRSVCAELENTRAKMVKDIQSLRVQSRLKSLQSGDGRSLGTVLAYEKRLNHELSNISAELQEKLKDSVAADGRLAMVDSEISGVRIEKKRIEKLIAARLANKRIIEVATEEDITDDINAYRRSRKDV